MENDNKTQLFDDVIKWKHFPRYWLFVLRIHRSPVNSPHKGQWRGALMFSLIGISINGWVNNREAGDLRRNRAHYDVIVMKRQLYAYVFGCTAHCLPRVMLMLCCRDVMGRFVRLAHFTYSMTLKGLCLAMMNQLIIYCTFVIMDTTPANSLPRENLFAQPA